METNPPPHSHNCFDLFTGDLVTGGYPHGSVALTIVDHRCVLDPPPVLFPRPQNYLEPHHYRAALENMAAAFCYCVLDLSPCCISSLVPELVAKIAAVAAHHCCYGVQSVELHVFPCSMQTDDETVLMESFNAAQLKPTPASLAWIEKLVAEKEGDESPSCNSSDPGGCMICLDDEIISRRSSLKMPCSHVFHQTCIVEWLKVSNVCPLCRYQMPVDDVDMGSGEPTVEA